MNVCTKTVKTLRKKTHVYTIISDEFESLNWKHIARIKCFNTLMLNVKTMYQNCQRFLQCTSTSV